MTHMKDLRFHLLVFGFLKNWFFSINAAFYIKSITVQLHVYYKVSHIFCSVFHIIGNMVFIYVQFRSRLGIIQSRKMTEILKVYGALSFYYMLKSNKSRYTYLFKKTHFLFFYFVFIIFTPSFSVSKKL
jgi:hypothetical protein